LSAVIILIERVIEFMLPKGDRATHSSILAWRIPWTQELVGYSPWGHKESDTTEQLTCTSRIIKKEVTLIVYH